MKQIFLFYAAVLILTVGAMAQTNYLSVQHPEWPPLPGPPSPSIELLHWEPGVVIMDDTNWKYPKVPAFTNSLPKWKDPAGSFNFATNMLARRPQDLQFFKQAMSGMNSTNGESKSAILMIQRRQAAMFAELERVAAWGRANPDEAKKLIVLDGDGKPLAESIINRTNSGNQ